MVEIQTLADITAAHVECPRCGHMQLDSSHCARCGVDLEQAFKQTRKEDLLIEKKIRDLRAKKDPQPSMQAELESEAEEPKKKGVFGWLKKH